MKLIHVKLEVVDWPTLVSRRQEEEGWDVYTTAGTAACADPSFLATEYAGKAPGRYYDPEVADLMKRIAQEIDFEKRYDMWVELESLVAENPNTIYPGWLFEYKGYRNNIRGVTEEVAYWNVYKE